MSSVSKNKVNVKSTVIISLKGRNHKVTIEEARILRDKLDELLGDKSAPVASYVPIIPYTPPIENPWYTEPNYPYIGDPIMPRPQITWTTDDKFYCNDRLTINSTLNQLH